MRSHQEANALPNHGEPSADSGTTTPLEFDWFRLREAERLEQEGLRWGHASRQLVTAAWILGAVGFLGLAWGLCLEISAAPYQTDSPYVPLASRAELERSLLFPGALAFLGVGGTLLTLVLVLSSAKRARAQWERAELLREAHQATRRSGEPKQRKIAKPDRAQPNGAELYPQG